ncbi:uncharacterized protein LOC133313358 [Gastrolobium bilobum]|uniref:uncharacterized protein LOC133313358 n=1 Tax=Gastrolobium bilobum TaxID=150636 RepID=UPI002AB14B91|nr:uncharacterized protein LOC133313358 [Gastrolobium bilobum]
MVGPTHTSDSIENTLAQLLQSQLTLQQDMQAIVHKVSTLETRNPIPTASSFSGPQPLTAPADIKAATLKLEVPRFDGSNALGWIFKITQFFEFHGTPEEQRPRIASFYMEGEALNWYQWMHASGQITSWPQLLQSLELCFAPSQYDDPKGDLMKLLQTTSIRDYQSQFEVLANRCIGLPHPYLLSCFISGLKPELRREVQALQPMTLPQAIGLARLQEDKLNDQRSQSRSKFFSGSQPSAFGGNRSPITTSTVTAGQSTPARTFHKPNIKRLSPEELQIRRDKGLCYNCDDKYHPTHKCKRQFLLLIASPDQAADDDDLHQMMLDCSNPTVDDGTDPPPGPTIDAAQISFHALLGHSVPQTLRVQGRVGKAQLSLLIDSGSTHNFIQGRIAKYLGLDIHQAQGFQVLVGNGEELNCSSMCQQVPLFIADHQFFVDFYLLPICGEDLVLGVQWLKTLGPVLTDYEALTMKFIKEGKLVLVQGVASEQAQELNSAQLKRLISTRAVAELYHLQAIPPHTTSTPPATYPHEIENILSRFHSLFEIPSELPPSRPTDHHIPLPHSSDPVNVRPYRYPYF